jgi:dolichol kinase
MALIPAAGWWLGYAWALGLAATFLVAAVLLELARHRWVWINRLLWRLLPTTFRAWETRRLMGSTWFGLGALATLLLLGRDAGGTAVLFLAWGDPAAEIIGRRWGGSQPGKTLTGSLGCLLACLVAALVGVGLGGVRPWAAGVGAIVATLVERRPPPPDDNVWMPLLGGLAIAALEWLFQ